MCARVSALIILFFLVVTSRAWAGADVDLVQVAGGVPIAGAGGATSFQTSFGTLNALGIGTPTTGVTAIPLGNGTLYITTLGIFPHGGLPNGHNAIVTAYVSTNFGHPAALIVESCPTTSTCNSSGQFSVMSTNVGAQTSVAPAPGIPKGTTATIGLAIFVPDNNGGTAFAGTDSATITFTMIDSTNGNVLETDPLLLNNPVETLQSAVQLTLSTGTVAAAHCSVVATGGTPNFTMNFGNIDALGINSGNCNKFAPATPGVGNAIYWSDYTLTPAFSDQNPTSNTTITAKVTTDFPAPHNIFVVRDSANSSSVPTSASQFTAVSTGTPDTIVTGVIDRTAVTRYIGLAVTPANGPGILVGAQSATITFTLTVQ